MTSFTPTHRDALIQRLPKAELHLHLDGSLRREWLETSSRPMEASLPEMLATILQAGEVLKERRDKAEREAALYEERRRLREAERARQKEDDDRWAYFVEAGGKWHEMARMRPFLAALKSMPVESADLVNGRSLAEWMDWADQRIAATVIFWLDQ